MKAKGSRRNFFRESGALRDVRMFQTPERGVWIGPLFDMARAAAATLDMNLPRDISREKLYSIYQHQHPGLIKVEHWPICRIRIKALRNWVRNSIHRLLETVDECDRREAAVIAEERAWLREISESIMRENARAYAEHGLHGLNDDLGKPTSACFRA